MKKRTKIIAANWKMNLDISEAAEWLGEVGANVENCNCDILVFPSFVMVGDLMDLYEGDKIMFGAQNCSHKESGAYTGEVSATQLSSVGVEYVIIGHSERREYFGESNEMLKEKLQIALKHELTPVFCCGEPLAVRNENKQQEYVKKQLEESLFSFSSAAMAEIIIAYEPVWAIGTGKNASPEQAQEMHAFIRREIAAKYSDNLAQEIPIIYGGSCKPDNAKELFLQPDVDGGLIGSASLKAKDFLSIIQAAG
jgi:triosephosphate isomerase (TIM)